MRTQTIKIIINHDEIDLLIAILKGYKGIKLDRLTLIIDKDQEYYLMNYSDYNFNNNELLEHLNLNYKLKNVNLSDKQSSPDSCVKCYTMFLPFLLIKIDVFS
ncbi:hypothetical protein UM654_05795 [Staphylococcus aureus]|nr:hypothetical protein UM654_05795 [Staphylococcus aureus]